jgi:hypothetical protein
MFLSCFVPSDKIFRDFAQLAWGANPFREQKIPSNANKAIFSWVTSKQNPEPSKTRDQVFVIRCHQYGCYNNAM